MTESLSYKTRNLNSFSGADVEIWISLNNSWDDAAAKYETNKTIKDLQVEALVNLEEENRLMEAHGQALADADKTRSAMKKRRNEKPSFPGARSEEDQKKEWYDSTSTQYKKNPQALMDDRRGKENLDLQNKEAGVAAAEAALKENRQGTEDLKTQIEELTGTRTMSSMKKLGECSSFTYSVVREKRPVRAVGQVSIKGLTRGPRLIAGSLISVVFDRAVLHEILEMISPNGDPRIVMIDQIPPVDIFAFFTNEYGAISRMALLGAEFVNEGQVMSINDLYTENSVNYIAREMQTLDYIEGSKDISSPSRRSLSFTPDMLSGEVYSNVRSIIKNAKFNTFD